MTSFSASELACQMRHPDVRGLNEYECKRVGKCFRCASLLPPRRQWWCSHDCVQAWTRNHEWTAARWEALRLTAPQKDARDFMEWANCDQCASRSSLEVNHVDPRVGAGYGRGCCNHQSNLQVLCHDDHVIETKRQAVERPVMVALEAGLMTADQAQGIIEASMAYKGRTARKRLGLRPLRSTPTPGFNLSLGL